MRHPISIGSALESREGAFSLLGNWPSRPWLRKAVADRERVVVAIKVSNLRSATKLILRQAGGESGFVLEFWNPLPDPALHRAYDGWLFQVIPADLLPEEGAEFALTSGPLVREVGGWVEVRSLEIRRLARSVSGRGDGFARSP